MKTSYFGKSKDDANAVAITAYCPSWFRGRHYALLAPPWSIVSQYKKNLINEEQYEELYFRHVLSNTTPQQVLRDLGPDAILLCYEKSGFCHRHIVAEWLRAAGIECEELS
jgi:hypothetical protein